MPENPLPHNIPGESIPAHFLYRSPSPLIGTTAVIVALTILAFAVAEVRTIGRSQPTLAFDSTGGPITEGTAILRITEATWTLNGQPLEESDRLFRLSGAAARTTAIVVEYSPGLPAADLESALQTISRAGYTQVGMQTISDAIIGQAAADDQTTASP